MAHNDKPVLTYFNGRGKAEIARLILAEAKVDYVDTRITDIAPLKTSGRLPFGQVPVFEHNGFVLPQSLAIERYLARTYNLYGTTLAEGATIDAIVDGTNDVQSARYLSKTDEEKSKFEKETLPRWLGYFEAFLQKNDSNGVLVGHQISWADLALFHLIDTVLRTYPQSTESFPLIKAHYAQVAARPNIAKWLKSRPETPF